MRNIRTLISSATLTALALTARADMVNRWSFSGATGGAPSGTAITDSISGTAATVRGGGATTSGTALTLPGSTTGNQTAPNISGYLDLPNGIISSKPNLTVEAWITPVSSKTWQRLFDFGSTNFTVGPGAATGEIIDTTTAPGSYTGWDNLTLSLNNNTTFGSHRLQARINNGATMTADVNLNASTVAGTEYHYVLTVLDGAGASGAAGCQAAWYRDGVLQKTLDLNFRLTQMADVNNWIGRSQFGSDSCSNIAINEVRIYNHAMSAAEVAASFAAGANPSFAPPVAQSDAATMHRGQKDLIAVLANDTGVLSGPTVAVVSPPAFGTAVPDGTGRILYTHTTGTPASDSFTYRVRGPGGTSSPATATITFSNSLRIANGTLNVPSTPPPLATQLAPAFTGLSSPVCLATPPGDTLRLFVCQKGGLLRVIQNVTATSPVISTFLDLPTLLTSRGEAISSGGEQGLLGVAFHPNYAANRYFYVFYSVTKGGSVYERVSRFTTQAGNPNAADTTSELVLIEQFDEASNHNGGDLHFGPDGYLYVSVGDEGNQNDSFNNSQRIDKDFYSGILRIDVDKKPGSIAPTAHASIPRDAGVARYAIPSDNPFVGATTFNGTAISTAALRAEFWAVGMRNPWRFSFDTQTGELWVGDVGSGTYEEVDVVVKGGNYGWAYREGNHNGPKSGSAPANFDTLYHKPPLYEYVHTGVSGGDANFKGNSITGGLVYRGTRFPSLTGAYIFADYVSGNIWSLVRNGANPPTVTRIAGEAGVVGFGTDPSNGDVLLADIDSGRILRITVETVAGSYPATLSATGLFADLTNLSPAPGVLPYAPNLPFWSDYAIKSRWFVIPDAISKMTWSRDGAWTFPAGQIWVKHFDLETTRGNPATKKRIETRLLVKNATSVYGVSYRWNDAGTEATLAPDGGADFDLNITVSGSPVTQRWRIPSRSDCLACHTPQAGHALSFNTRQLNLANTINGFADNQITLLKNAGYFGNIPASPDVLPRHHRPDETAVPLESRARSFLAVNCAYCHQAGGTAAPAAWDGRPELTLAQTGLINGVAVNNGGNASNKLIVPGDTAHSIVLSRIAVTNGFTRMPPLASSELDQANITLMTGWITSIPINADLASLAPSVGTLSPVFASGTTSYTASVSNATASITVTPTVAQTGATVKVNGNIVTSGTASAPVILNVGANTITTAITALNGNTTKTYTLTVTRASNNNADLASLVPSAGTLAPIFSPSTTSYTVGVTNGTSTIKITPTVATTGATVKVNNTAVASGTASASIPLLVGSNTITTVVTAQNGTTTKIYTVVVTRAGSSTATLASFVPSAGSLTPVFAKATTSYSVSVSNSTTSIKVTPTVSQANATVKVNGVSVTSGTASAPIPLTVGSNTITTVVTAQNGTTTKTYKLAVSRAGTTNADLISLLPSIGKLSPAFISTTLAYTESINNSTLSIRLTPVTADPAANVTVNGLAVTSGMASTSIPLVVGSNVINTVVTAQDGITTKTYKLTVTVTADPSVAGYYTGLATPTAASTNPPRQVGLVAVSVLSTGTYTGKITLGGSSTAIAFSGALAGNTTTQNIVRAGLPTLTMALTASGDVMTGTLTEGATVVSAITLNKLLYTATVPAVAPLKNVPLSVLNPAAENGSYTGIFQALAPTNPRQTPGLTKTDYPQGGGWVTLKVNTSGSVTVSGKLGDGQTVSYTNYLSKNNVLAFFISPYSGTGTVSGLVSFRDTPGQSDVDGLSLVWFKVAKSNDTSYRSGWPNGIKVDLIGSKFIAPTLANVNARITLRDGNLAGALTNQLSVNGSSQVTVLDPAIGAQSLAVTLATNGSFTGSFLHPVSNKSTAIGGVILQKTQNGSGYFMGLPATGTVSQSGAVTISVP